VFLVDGHSRHVSAKRAFGSNGDGVSGSSMSVLSPGFRTMTSIFRLNCSCICGRYSGRMSIDEYSKAIPRSPARWLSMTVEVRIGTTCIGNLEIFRATRMSILAPRGGRRS